MNSIIKFLTQIICRIDDAQLERVPNQGPLIIICNHINFIEVPILYTRLLPRPITGFLKAETWDNFLLGYIAEQWNAIPIHRGEADISAIRTALSALERGHIVVVTPEGTRSGHGRLLRGHPGVVMLALQSNAPLLPLAYYGGERLRQNLKKIRRTNFQITVGNPFLIHPPSEPVNKQIRNKIISEIMYQLAALLPPSYRGYYKDLTKATESYLHFPEGSKSNLKIETG
jgi:1-acyl-sn-glycerol-3-phosphate acyltransferase